MVRRERALRDLARREGWQLEGRVGSGHGRLRHPSGAVVVASFSPRSGGHDLIRAELRRAARSNKQLKTTGQHNIAGRHGQ